MRRRLLIGGNVVLAVVMVWLIVILVNFMLAKASPMPVDVTRGGQFSISPRTVKLLQGLEEKVTLTAMYRVDDLDEKVKQENVQQKRRVEDLLRRYQDVTDKVRYRMIDPLKDNAAKAEFLKALIAKYSGEAAKHADIVKAFKSTIHPQVVTLVGQEKKRFDALMKNPALVEANPKLQTVAEFFNNYERNAKIPTQEVDSLINGEDVPRYSEAIEIIQKLYQTLQTNMQAISKYLAGEGAKIEGLPAEDKAAFAEAAARYKEVLDPIGKQLSQMTGLPRLELEQIYDQVKQKNAKTIIVETEKSPKVKVLSFSDVWAMAQPKPGAPMDRPEYDFNGEAAVSSAIMALTVKDKSAVIFVHAGPPNPIQPGFNGMRMTQPPYGALKEKLEQANFVVSDWDVAANPQPQVAADVKHKVFIVLPPSPPQRPQQMGMPPAGGYQKAQVEAIEKLIDQGERMMFLVNFSPVFLGGTPYPFTETLEKKYGIKPDPDKLTLKGFKAADKTYPSTQIEVVRYDDSPITRPIQSLNSGFQLAVPVTLTKAPEDVQTIPLITLTDDQGIFWGESNIMMLAQNRWAERGEGDLQPPFYLAVAAENSKTKGKVVVFGDDLFATDQIMNDVQLVPTPQGVMGVYTNPGNGELLTNCAFWLNDNENLISVGPRKADVARIRDISDGGQMAWKVFLWVIWPLGILSSGGVVYLIRRK